MNTRVLKKAEELVSLLKQKKLKIAVAESCTGGMVASYITSVSGASRVFEMGIVSYSNSAKNQLLKISHQTLDGFGAITKETAKEMAQSIRSLSGADIGISVTGVAGPNSMEGQKAGTVFIGYSDKNRTEIKRFDIKPKSRHFVREQTVFQLLDTVVEHINEQN